MDQIASRKRKSKDMRDLISGLSDSVLVHILSLLPTKEAVSTCLLSKRWTSLWHQITKLEFDGRRFGNLDSFLHFVDATLGLVDLNLVQTFVMKNVKVPSIKLHIWLQILLHRNSIEYLELDSLQPPQRGRFPLSLFKCNTITDLKLSGVSIGNISAVDLSSLKVLHLKFVISSTKHIQVLLSHCLHLEELVLRYLLPSNLDFPLQVRFEHLRLAHVLGSLFSMEAFSNVQFLTFQQIKRNTPFDLPTFHNVIHLEIICLFQLKWAIVECLPSFPKLQSLVFQNSSFGEANSDSFMEDEAHEVPPCISSHLEEFALVNFSGSRHEFKLVRFIMENASILRTVVISVKGLGDRSSKENEYLEMCKTLSYYARLSAKCRLFFETTSTLSDGALKKYLTIRKTSVAPSY